MRQDGLNRLTLMSLELGVTRIFNYIYIFVVLREMDRSPNFLKQRTKGFWFPQIL